MRMMGWIVGGACFALTACAHAASPARVLIDQGDLREDAPFTDRVALSLALSDTSEAWEALAAVPDHDPVGGWLRARLFAAQGRAAEACAAIESVVGPWQHHAAAEPPEVARQFDRDRLRFALAIDSPPAASAVMAEPVAAHDGDSRWDALCGSASLAARDAEAAVQQLDLAWSEGDGWERRDPAFGQRALAHLSAGDAEAATAAWFDYVEGVAWPFELRAAMDLWDHQRDLRDAVARDGYYLRLVHWLARILRRDEAYEVARTGWKSAPAAEAAACYVAAAEQLYKLRRHDDLATLLAQERPTALDAEQRAALAAYPWGVRRRSETTAEVAAGFDSVVRDFADTDRGAEALWEAAWVWELAENVDAAQDRFLRYAREHSRGPFADSAALRAIFLRYQAGQPEAALEIFEALRSTLGDGLNQAAALWLAARTQSGLGQATAAQQLTEELASDHPGNPFLAPPPYPLRSVDLATACDLDAVLRSLFTQQEEALDRLATALELADLRPDAPELLAAERLLELGLFWEGDGLLNAYAASRRADSQAQLRALAVAWRQGRPERQARIAFLLERRLRGQSPALDRALWTVTHPTPYARSVLESSRRAGLPPALLWSLMRRESFYDAEVVSLAGAHGLMQLLPTTAAKMATSMGDASPAPRELHQPRVNLRYGSTYLAQLLKECEGDVYQALASYNAGEANGRRWAQRRAASAPPQETILWISYSETRAYVYYVLRSWQLYQLSYDALACADGSASR